MWIVPVLSILIILYTIKSKKVHTKTELTIDKEINEEWEVMGNQFAQVHVWSSNFKES
jgi:hypothetical protein